MVVLAATICTKGGKVVVSRQFLEMTRSRIEGLMASFPKLISSGTQHTTVDTEEVRFVYQPLEELFMVLTTSKKSNILQDIDTLHLFARVVSEFCRHLDEKEIAKHAFELLNAFDEIVSLGYRENVGLPQIRTINEMESHEEKIQEMIARNKEMEAKEELKRKMKQIEHQKKQMAKMGGTGMGGIGGMGMGMASGGYGSGSMGGGMGGGGMGGGMSGMSQMTRGTFDAPPQQPVSTAGSMKTGMKLGGSKKNDFMEAFKQETGLEEPMDQMAITGAQPGMGVQSASPVATPMASSSPVSNVKMEGVHVQIEERLSVVVNRDGGLQNLEIKGDLMLRVNDPDKSRVKVGVKVKEEGGVQFKTHPNMDKKLFTTDSVLMMKDSSKTFPLGQPQSVLKWRFTTKDEAEVPLSVNCWPSPAGDGSCDVNIEYELEKEKLELHDVVIAIPIPHNAGTPTISEVSGHYTFDPRQSILLWSIPIIDKTNSSGTLEFNVKSEEPGAFFPVSVGWKCEVGWCDVEILDVKTVEGMSVSFSKESTLIPEQYQIV